MNKFGIGVEKRKEAHISLTAFFREYYTLCIVLKTFEGTSRSATKYIKDSTSTQQYSFITIKVSDRQHVSTHQVVIIRSITESYRIVEGCAHICDPNSVYKRAYW